MEDPESGFKKYQDIERFGTDETQGIDVGMCYIFPKIDGTNSSIWLEDGIVKAGSRNRLLSIEKDNAGFYNWVLKQENIRRFFGEYPDVRLFGEWLVPHTLKTYEQSAWRNFYVFDVWIEGLYVDYEAYQPMLEEFGIQYIPPLCKINNPTYEKLTDQLDKNYYLIQDGKGPGEGIVIKNYGYRNRYGRQMCAKIVRNEFKTRFYKQEVSEVKTKRVIEQEIVNKFITSALVEKEYAKIAVDGWNSKKIPQLLGTVYYCLVKEECWNFVKLFKNPVVDFKRLNTLTIAKIKELIPQIF